MNTLESTAPLLVTRDAALVDSVQATALALGVELAVVADREELRHRWPEAPLRLVGPDVSARAAVFDGGPGTWAVGFDQAQLLRASAELGAPALQLPDASSRLAEVLADCALGQSAAQVVAVMGASGGLGVSSLAVALATRAAEAGLRAAAIELAPCGGGLDLLFGAETQPGMTWDDLSHAAGEVGDLGPHLITAQRVTVLALGRQQAAHPDEAAVAAVLRSMERSHDFVVVDAGDGAWLGALGRRITPLLMVGADVHSVAAARMRAERLGLVGALLVVRVAKGRSLPGPLVAEALGLPLVGIIRQDPRVPRLAAQGGSVGSRQATRLRADSTRLLKEVRR
ncbi:MAG: hypothetical protein Q4D79_06430 [Propionibacteriaceae bacterium]|nr:hypothetical protein [Propionibacteriaceae bacterium]